MSKSKAELLDQYNLATEFEQDIIHIFVAKFTGFSKYEVYSKIQDLLTTRISQASLKRDLGILIQKGLMHYNSDRYEIPVDLKIALFPRILNLKRLSNYIEELQNAYYFYWNEPMEEHLRNFLYGIFTGMTEKSRKAGQYLSTNPADLFQHYLSMIDHREYDLVWDLSDEITYSFIDVLSVNLFFLLERHEQIYQFLMQHPQIKGSDILGRLELLKGNIDRALRSCETPIASDQLLLRAQVELFRGNFALSSELYEKARVTDNCGQKVSRCDFDMANEYFAWLNFLFLPDKLNLKKLEAFSKKVYKKYEPYKSFLLPLVFMLKKDLIGARASFPEKLQPPTNILGLINLFNWYLVEGFIPENQYQLAIPLCQTFFETQNWLFLNELQYMLETSELEVPVQNQIPSEIQNLPKPILSNLVKQEQWEIALEGLVNALGGTSKTEASPKNAKTTRVAYLLNNNDHQTHIQPVLQSYSAKSGWTEGRNIAMKRLKERNIEGMSEQDSRVASTIYSYSVHSTDHFNFSIEKALNELCGHPYLFLFKNPSVSIELVKDNPVIFTEETHKGIVLKTNVADDNKTQIVVRETQTRWRIITLTSEQQKVVRMIQAGITVPRSGMEKLLKTISQLSTVMSVHSDLAQESHEMKTAEADSRIRLQILPIGDGLKAEMFVKPFNTEPPYFKPGKGGKVAYGTVNNEKYQALRNLEKEKTYAETVNNVLNELLDADLFAEPVLFSDPYDCLELLEIANKHRDIAVVEWPEGERFKLRKYATSANLHLSVKGKNNWFEMDGTLQVDEETVLSVQQLLQLSKKSKGRFIELGDGEILSLTEELKKQLDELAAFVQDDKSKLKINFFATQAVDALTEQAGSFKSDKAWKELQKKIAESEKLEILLPTTLEAELRTYQEEGFRWLMRLNAWGAGACLADDMGLGKTLQAIAAMLSLAPNGPSLVVCPASVINNWCNELTKFAPTLNPIVLKPGNARKETFATLSEFDVLVVSYGLLQSEEEAIGTIEWSMAVLDEAHAIKNTNTKSSKAAMGIKAGFRLALTGTPVQNHLGELWNLFQFCNPGLLGSLQHFTDRYVKNDVPEQKAHLKKLISPFILRRTKNKVLSELPPKTEITHSVELSNEELAFYEALRREAISVIESGGGNAGQQHLQALAEITRLRLACCNPALVNAEIDLPSSKLAAFLEIIEELRANKHRALVFSQFIGHLAIVRQSLDQLGVSYQYLDGSTSLPDREKAVKAFQAGKGELFLISLKAGGLGLNLTAADYVIHLDPWWNPAIEDQASDRAHRMGQTRPVTIYRLVTKNTIEEKILQLHATKRDMADTLLEGSDQNSRLNTKELLELLKEG